MDNEYVKISLNKYEEMKQESKKLKSELRFIKESKYIIPESLSVAITFLIMYAIALTLIYFEAL